MWSPEGNTWQVAGMSPSSTHLSRLFLSRLYFFSLLPFLIPSLLYLFKHFLVFFHSPVEYVWNKELSNFGLYLLNKALCSLFPPHYKIHVCVKIPTVKTHASKLHLLMSPGTSSIQKCAPGTLLCVWKWFKMRNILYTLLFLFKYLSQSFFCARVGSLSQPFHPGIASCRCTVIYVTAPRFMILRSSQLSLLQCCGVDYFTYIFVWLCRILRYLFLWG